jgi:hypothetical protein
VDKWRVIEPSGGELDRRFGFEQLLTVLLTAFLVFHADDYAVS